MIRLLLLHRRLNRFRPQRPRIRGLAHDRIAGLGQQGFAGIPSHRDLADLQQSWNRKRRDTVQMTNNHSPTYPTEQCAKPENIKRPGCSILLGRQQKDMIGLMAPEHVVDQIR